MTEGQVVASDATPLPTEESRELNGALQTGETAPPRPIVPEPTTNGHATAQGRPKTPPPSQPVFAPSNSRTGSSQDSIVVATQNTTLWPAKSTLRVSKTAEPESPDPLQLIPVRSAASSAARPRNDSVEPACDFFRSSPSRVTARSRSKTPVPRDQAGENDPSGLDEVVALRTPRLPRADDTSDDEIGMSPIRASRPRRQTNKGRDDPGQEGPERKKGSKTAAARVEEYSPAHPESGPPSHKRVFSGPVRTERHSFELIINQPERSVRPKSYVAPCAPSANVHFAADAPPLFRLPGAGIVSLFACA